MRASLGQHGELWLRGSYSERPDLDGYYSPSTQRRGYRLYYQSLEHLYSQQTLSSSLRPHLSQPAGASSSTYLHLSYNYTNHGYYRDYTYSLDRTVSIPIDSTHHRQTFSAAGVVDKSIAPLGLSLHAELRYRHSSYISSQAQRVYQIQSDLLVPSLTMTCNKLSPLELAYTFELSSLWIHHPLTKLRPVLSLRETSRQAYPSVIAGSSACRSSTQ